jgi:hypothetical protein
MSYKSFFLFILFILTWTACDQRSPYEKLLAQELATGERHDSLFYGLSLGMTTKDFFEQCYKKNQEGSFFQGEGTVKYPMKNELPFPATMNFYPKFQDKKIVEMPVTFIYDAWAPWNKRLFADSLQLDVKNLFEKWYGTGFIRTEHPKLGVAFVKIDGNRRIVLVKEDDKTAKALITDMSVEQTEEAQPAK